MPRTATRFARQQKGTFCKRSPGGNNPFLAAVRGLFLFVSLGLFVMPARCEQFTVPVPEPVHAVQFDYRRPVGTNEVRGVLLLAPTFHASGEEIHHRLGYNYPALWRGAAVEAALDELAKREKISTDKTRIFGISPAHISRIGLRSGNRLV